MHQRIFHKSLALLFIIILIFSFFGTVISFEYNEKSHNQFVIKNIIGQGKTCFGYQAFPNPDLIVSFDIDNPEALNTIGTPITSDKIAGGTWVDGVWWCCEYSSISNSKIWIINHLTGDMTLIGESGEGLNGLAYDDTTGIMYACSSTHLFSINISTGVATMVGPFDISGCVMVGIACDGYGKMYGEDLHTDSLYLIDPTTADTTLIGPFGLDFNYGQDIAFDKETGVCYLSAFTVDDGNEGALYICNISTAELTKIGNLGLVPTQITGFAIPYNFNDPPSDPIINGPKSGKVGETYYYSFTSSDPDGDDIYYHLCWGDKEIIYIYGPYPSGEKLILPYNWSDNGVFIITCWARDTNNDTSEISTLEVSIPRNKFFLNTYLQLYFKQYPMLERLICLIKVL
ncbi:MAG: hypothetical protein AYK22_07820 [Thermoplasmatales archaeon SG8-52-3]|nr:MAG: hypothetical protein AYK22_07820 [Thermoplasmatales archaeon SG8-52-3]